MYEKLDRHKGGDLNGENCNVYFVAEYHITEKLISISTLPSTNYFVQNVYEITIYLRKLELAMG